MALLTKFLSQIHLLVRSQNGDSLREWLRVEPPVPAEYHNLAAELRAKFPRSDASSTASLEATIERLLPEDHDVPDGQASPWPGFLSFMKDYLQFWRDINYDDLLAAHLLLSGLVK
jgi:nuclear mRNA export protein PCID2/THP1